MLVELAEDVDVGGRVGPVGVNDQGKVPAVLADGPDQLEVLAGLDLDLDPAVTGLDVGLDRLDQLDDAGLEPDGQSRLDAHVDPQVGGSHELGDRGVAGLAQQVP